MSAFRVSGAAITRRNGIAVRASLGMGEKRAYTLIEFGADDVFKSAGLRVGLGVVNGESVFEKALCQTMAAHDTSCALATHRRKLRLTVLQFDQMALAHPAQSSYRWLTSKNGKSA